MTPHPEPAAHVVFFRSCAHLNEDARQEPGGELVCDLCGAKVTPRICTGPTKETKSK